MKRNICKRSRSALSLEKQNRFTRLMVKVCTMAAVCALLSGCSASLALPDENENPQQDQLVGLFVTREHLDLFDMDAWLNDNADKLLQADGGMIEADDQSAYTQRLYGQFVPRENGEATLQFPGYEGWYFVHHPNETYHSDSEDEVYTAPDWSAPNDVHSTGVHVNVSDEGEELTYNGVFYFALDTQPRPQPTEEPEILELEDGTAISRVPDDWRDEAFYINPVYADSDGNVYAVTGNGVNFSQSESEGEVWSVTISENYTQTTGEETESRTTTYKLAFYGVWPSVQYRILQLDADGMLLQTASFSPAELPESLELLAQTDCLLVERSYEHRDGSLHAERLAFDRSEGFLDGSRKEGDLIWTNTGENGPVLNLPVASENAFTFAYHQIRLVVTD